jgi:hypothetical protein
MSNYYFHQRDQLRVHPFMGYDYKKYVPILSLYKLYMKKGRMRLKEAGRIVNLR